MVIAEQAKGLYKTTLTAYAQNGRIITADEKSTLDKMAEFLSMDSSAVDEIHSEVVYIRKEQGRHENAHKPPKLKHAEFCADVCMMNPCACVCTSCGKYVLFVCASSRAGTLGRFSCSRPAPLFVVFWADFVSSIPH